MVSTARRTNKIDAPKMMLWLTKYFIGSHCAGSRAPDGATQSEGFGAPSTMSFGTRDR